MKTLTSIFAGMLLLGCTSSSELPERRVGQVLVCHHGEKTLNVSNADYHRHLAHGDQGGPCPETGHGGGPHGG